jgi:hypothetical protein
MLQLLLKQDYQVLYVSLRGAGGSGGDFDGLTIHSPMPTGHFRACVSSRGSGGALATWGQAIWVFGGSSDISMDG